MATKRPPPGAKSAQRGSSLPRGATPKAGPALAPTETPGVFRNTAGVLVNSAGVALSLMDAKKADADDLASVVGHEVTTPAQYMKAVALDPRVPLATRLEAAKAAAPYTDRKQPMALDGGLNTDGTPRPIQLEMTDAMIAALTPEERSVLKKALAVLRPQEAA